MKTNAHIGDSKLHEHTEPCVYSASAVEEVMHAVASASKAAPTPAAISDALLAKSKKTTRTRHYDTSNYRPQRNPITIPQMSPRTLNLEQ